MGRISAYEAADGQIFKDRAKYLQHSRDLVAGIRMRALIDAQVSDDTVAKAVGDFYAANAGALRDLLNSKDITIDGKGDDDTVEAGTTTEPAAAAGTTTEPAAEPEGGI